MKKIFYLVISLAITASSSFCFANAETAETAENITADELIAQPSVTKEDRNLSGFYLNANFGFGESMVSHLLGENLSNLMGISDTSFSWSANIGYQFSPYVAVEAGYMALPYASGTQISFSSGTWFVNDVHFKTNAVTLAAKGMLPLHDNAVDLFVKAGMAYQFQSINGVNNNAYPVVPTSFNSSGISPLVGAGMDFNLNEHLAFELQGVATIAGNSNFADSYSALAGMTYRFK